MSDAMAKELNAGQRLLADGEYEKAVKKFDKAIKLDPKSAEAYYGKAEAAVASTKLGVDEILETYAKACELQPQNPFYLSNYGAFCLQTGKVSEAEELYKKAAEVDAENAGFYYNELGYEYYQAMLRQYEDKINDGMRTEIRKKAAKYLLRAIGIEAQEKDLAELVK